MIKTDGYAAPGAGATLEPFSFQRREVGARDVLIEIQYCGVCHSDIHQVRDEWGGSIYPMVPGHEIVGRVARTGAEVSKLKEGDLAGVGCFVDSCRACRNCKEGKEQYCENHLVSTYNGTEKDERTPTYGGYSTKIVVDEGTPCASPRASRSRTWRRCSAPGLRPTRRCDASRCVRGSGWASSASAAWATWA
jgi:alcohol dehydrogenase (NADP+)